MEAFGIGLPDPTHLIRIEQHFWTIDGSVPASANVVVRGAPITGEKFLAHAARQSREYSLSGRNMASVSVDLVMADWPLNRILSEQLLTYSRYATCSLADLVDARFKVLATGRAPHADVVLPALGIVEAERLASMFALTETRNPYKQRR
jgi:hypothetical protein